MKTNVDQLFFRDTVLPKATGTYCSGDQTVAQSYVLDLRKHGNDHTRDLIVRLHLGNADEQTAGEAAVRLQVSSDQSSWTDVGSSVVLSRAAVDANGEIILPFPRTGVKQFMRVKIVTSTAFTKDPVLFGGLDADGDYDVDVSLVDTGRQTL